MLWALALAAAAVSSSAAAATAMKRVAEEAFGGVPLYTCEICQNWSGDSQTGLQVHRKRSGICNQVECGETVAVAAPLGKPPTPSPDALMLRAKERQHEVVDVLTNLRVQKLVPGTHVQSVKDALETKVLPVMRRHLQLELQPHVNCSGDELHKIIARCTGLFDGIETSSREHTALLNREGFVRRLSRHTSQGTPPKMAWPTSGATPRTHTLLDAPHLCRPASQHCCARVLRVPPLFLIHNNMLSLFLSLSLSLPQTLLTPVERILGTRQKQTPGADGAPGQTTIKVTDSCWDLPVEKTLRRWLQNCPRALAEVLAFQERMHDRAMAEHGTVVALVDLCDGDLYRGHPVLGDAARRNDPTHKRSIPGDPSSPWVPVRMPLSIVLYYDDVEYALSRTQQPHIEPL